MRACSCRPHLPRTTSFRFTVNLGCSMRTRAHARTHALTHARMRALCPNSTFWYLLTLGPLSGIWPRAPSTRATSLLPLPSSGAQQGGAPFPSIYKEISLWRFPLPSCRPKVLGRARVPRPGAGEPVAERAPRRARLRHHHLAGQTAAC